MSSRPVTVLFVTLLGCVVTSCNSRLNHVQYRLTPAIAGDRARVSRILQSVAGETELNAQQPPPFAQGSFAYYDNVVVHGPIVALFVSAHRDGIVVDLEGGPGPIPPRFVQSERLLDQRLSAVFGSRCAENTRVKNDI